ncbi:hypothetical protein H6P81_009322 [Aristolochia fimbriata]|uniref:Uncharacterized protein n=1 Tax=Aristolochia fimbriata TaxID=158543 RepID=A0AAV7ENN9_ARIFI|nr:hypothetical protein H6P81_009322 [Aristolochia fimbriata]
MNQEEEGQGVQMNQEEEGEGIQMNQEEEGEGVVEVIHEPLAESDDSMVHWRMVLDLLQECNEFEELNMLEENFFKDLQKEYEEIQKEKGAKATEVLDTDTTSNLAQALGEILKGLKKYLDKLSTLENWVLHLLKNEDQGDAEQLDLENELNLHEAELEEFEEEQPGVIQPEVERENEDQGDVEQVNLENELYLHEGEHGELEEEQPEEVTVEVEDAGHGQILVKVDSPDTPIKSPFLRRPPEAPANRSPTTLYLALTHPSSPVEEEVTVKVEDAGHDQILGEMDSPDTPIKSPFLRSPSEAPPDRSPTTLYLALTHPSPPVEEVTVEVEDARHGQALSCVLHTSSRFRFAADREVLRATAAASGLAAVIIVVCP